MIDLKGPDGAHAWKPNLRHIAAIEQDYGSLYLLAEHLLDQSLSLSAIVGVVKLLYRQAGCTAEDSLLDAFLLRQPCTSLLVRALLEVLKPIETNKEKSP
jgi:hypothetical protein